MKGCPIDTVFFDIGGTVLAANPSVGAVYADAAARRGYEIEVPRIDANFAAAWRSSLSRRAAAGHVCTDAVLRADWRKIVGDTFEGLVDRVHLDEIFEDLYARFSRSDAWRVADGAIETFETLRAAGIGVGVLSNWDQRLEETLESLDLLRYFDHVAVSWRVGVEKPHPKIFAAALAQAGTDASRALHVGDSYDWDIIPARRLGLHALWLNSKGPTARVAGPDTDTVPEISRLDEVIEFLEALA